MRFSAAENSFFLSFEELKFCYEFTSFCKRLKKFFLNKNTAYRMRFSAAENNLNYMRNFAASENNFNF